MTAPRIEHVDATASSDAIATILERDGCIVIDRLLDDVFCDRILAELEPWMARVPTGGGDWVGKKTRRVHGLVAKSAAVRENVCHPLVLETMDRMLGPWCDAYQLSACSTTSIDPGEKAQELHRDDLMFPFTHPTERVAYCTTFWALDAFTAENGATRIVPGSHRWDDVRRPREDEVVQAVMPRGSVVIFTCAVWHGGGANTTADQWRRALFTSYSVGWLKQEEQQFLVSPPDIARHYPERLQRLVGYQVHRPFLGWYDLQDPIELLRGYEELSAPDQDLYAPGENQGVLSRKVRRA